MAQTDYRCDSWCYALQDYCAIGNDPAICKYAKSKEIKESDLQVKVQGLEKKLIVSGD